MFDSISLETLRSRGSVKWSGFPGTIGAFIAEMDFGTAPAVTKALTSVVNNAQLGYLPDHLKTTLGEAYAEFSQQRYGTAPQPEHVRPIVDVVEALIAVINHYTTPGSPIIVPTPAYMPFLTVGGLTGREIVQLPLINDGGTYRYDLDALAAAFTHPGQLLVLCHPHNPIGRVLTRKELEAISEVVEAKGGVVFSDEIHAPITYASHSHIPYASISSAAAAHTITATSTSKAWNVPGLKAAQIIFSNPNHVEIWNAVGSRYEQMAATVGMYAAIAAYSDGQEWLAGVIDYLDRNRKLLGELVSEHLPGVVYREPEGTFLAWLDTRELELPGRAADFFREKANVALTAGEDCGTAGFVRLNFATPSPILIQAVEAMGEALIHR